MPSLGRVYHCRKIFGQNEAIKLLRVEKIISKIWKQFSIFFFLLLFLFIVSLLLRYMTSFSILHRVLYAMNMYIIKSSNKFMLTQCRLLCYCNFQFEMKDKPNNINPHTHTHTYILSLTQFLIFVGSFPLDPETNTGKIQNVPISRVQNAERSEKNLAADCVSGTVSLTV